VVDVAEHFVGDVDDLEASERRIVRIGGTDVALLWFRGEVLAFENRCLHQGGPVGEGMLINRVVADIDEDGKFRGERFDEDQVHIVCPWHGWEYALPSGECAVAPRITLRKLPVRVEDGRVLLTLDESAAQQVHSGGLPGHGPAVASS
jgi:nitrite reductase (NADH) small subunit